MARQTRAYDFSPPEDFPGHGQDKGGDAERTGLAFLQAIVSGEVPQPPIAETLGFHLIEVGPGLAIFEAEVGAFVLNPLGGVHGGFYATILDSCMSCAVHTELEAGVGYTTAEFKVNIVRGLKLGARGVRAEGRVLHGGRRIMTSEGRLLDPDGRLVAHGTATCYVFRGE